MLDLELAMRALDANAMQHHIRAFGAYLLGERMLAPATVKRYCAVVESLARVLVQESGEVRLESVTKAQVTAFLRTTAENGGTPSRAKWNSHLAALRSFYLYLQKQEQIMTNPALLIERLRLKTTERLPLSFDEVLNLIDAVREHSPRAYRSRNEALIQIFFHCSLRVAEVVSLNLEQVDLRNRAFLSVRVKGDKRLAVLMNDLVADALEKYLSDREKLHLPQEERALFVSQLHRRLAVRTVEDLVKHYAKLAEISRPVSPHLLRHASATELADIAPLRVVQEHLGHASVTTTEKYVHVGSTERRRAVDELASVWRREERRRRRAAEGR